MGKPDDTANCPDCDSQPGYHAGNCEFWALQQRRVMDDNESRYRALIDRFTALGREDWASDLRSNNSYRMQPARLSLSTLESMSREIEELRALVQHLPGSGKHRMV